MSSRSTSAAVVGEEVCDGLASSVSSCAKSGPDVEHKLTFDPRCQV